jgi:hypothetical protein
VKLPGVVVRPGAITIWHFRFLKLFRAIDRCFWMLGTGENFYHLVYLDLINGMILAGERETALGEIFILADYKPIQVKVNRMIAEAWAEAA